MPNKFKDYLFALIPAACCIGLTSLLIFFPGLFAFLNLGKSSLANETVKVSIGNSVKEINVTGKSFQQVCSETFGTWMSKEDGMMPQKNGKTLSSTPCDGCMPITDANAMICDRADYISFLKEQYGGQK